MNAASPTPSQGAPPPPGHNTPPERPAFDRYFWGDAVTLKLLLGACVLMGMVGVIHVLARLWSH
jgi:hypothetical protein